MKNSLLFICLINVLFANGQSISAETRTLPYSTIQPMPTLPLPQLGTVTSATSPKFRLTRSINCWDGFATAFILSNGIPAQYNSHHFESKQACRKHTDPHSAFFNGSLLLAVTKDPPSGKPCHADNRAWLMPHPLQFTF